MADQEDGDLDFQVITDIDHRSQHHSEGKKSDEEDELQISDVEILPEFNAINDFSCAENASFLVVGNAKGCLKVILDAKSIIQEEHYGNGPFKGNLGVRHVHVIMSSNLVALTAEKKNSSKIYFYNTATHFILHEEEFYSEIKSLSGFAMTLIIEFNVKKLAIYNLRERRVQRFVSIDYINGQSGFRYNPPTQTYSTYFDSKIRVYSRLGVCQQQVKSLMNWAVCQSKVAIALQGGYDIQVYSLPKWEMLGRLYRGMLSKSISMIEFIGESNLALISNSAKLATLHLYVYSNKTLLKNDRLPSRTKVKYKSWEQNKDIFMTRELSACLVREKDSVVLLSPCNFVLTEKLPLQQNEEKIVIVHDGEKRTWFK